MAVYEIRNKRKFPRINTTLLLVLINSVCFIVFTILIAINSNFLDYIALKPLNIFTKSYFWTFLTSMFMHAGFFHIFANMLSLIFIGGFVEKIIGKRRYIGFYLAAGLFAGIFFVLASFVLANFFNFSGDFNTYAVGASGALFGLVGLLMVLTPNLPVYVMFIPIPVKMKYAAPAMLVILWLISYFGNVPIGNTAHLGGFIAGIIYGFYLRKKYRNKSKYIRKLFS